MPVDKTLPQTAAGGPAQDQADRSRPLSPAAERALAEAAARRTEREHNPPQASKEVQGRGGLDPTRYGDWEIDGLACDF